MLEFCTLGTGGTLPIPERALSSLYVRVNGKSMLIDCGEGTQVGIRKLGWGFRCMDGLLLTHYHGDHCTGLAGLLLSLEKGTGRTVPYLGSERPETGCGRAVRYRTAPFLCSHAA